jgi:hypothetical protein
VLLIISHQDAARLAGARQWRVENGRMVEIIDDLATVVLRS